MNTKMNINNVFTFISSLCKQSYMQPKVVEKRMRKHYELTCKYQTKLWTRTILERLTNLNVGTDDIKSHASKLVQKMNEKKMYSKYQNIVHDNMLYKLTDALENEEKARLDMIPSNIELKKVVNLHTISGNEYKQFVDRSWNRNWNKSKRECQKKVDWLENKQKKELEMIVQKKNVYRNKSKGLEMIVQKKEANTYI